MRIYNQLVLDFKELTFSEFTDRMELSKTNKSLDIREENQLSFDDIKLNIKFIISFKHIWELVNKNIKDNPNLSQNIILKRIYREYRQFKLNYYSSTLSYSDLIDSHCVSNLPSYVFLSVTHECFT